MSSLPDLTGYDTKKHCPVVDTLDIIGGKWKVLIIYHIHNPDTKPKRFNELRRCLPGITQRMLTMQLKELVRDGLVIRHDYKEVPPKVEYYLSETGLTILPLLAAMSDWGKKYASTCLDARSQFEDNDTDDDSKE